MVLPFMDQTNLMAGNVAPKDVRISISVEISDPGNRPTRPYVRDESAVDDVESVHQP
jgi:hypothetical protein